MMDRGEEDDDLSVFSDGSVPSVGEDLKTPDLEYLVLRPDRCRALGTNKNEDPVICPHLATECTKRGHRSTLHRGPPGAYKVLKGPRGGIQGVSSVDRLSVAQYLAFKEERLRLSRSQAGLSTNPDLTQVATSLDRLSLNQGNPTPVREKTQGSAPGPGPTYPEEMITPPPDEAERGSSKKEGSPSVTVETVTDASDHTPSSGLATDWTSSTGSRPPVTEGEARAPSPDAGAFFTWYGIQVGRHADSPGVYQDWPTVARHVIGCPQAIWARFDTRAAAEAFVQDGAKKPSAAPPPAPRPALKTKRWYAVAIGRYPEDTGVYDSWAEVDRRVTGVSGAVHKGRFKTREEAQAYLDHAMGLTSPGRMPPVFIQGPPDTGGREDASRVSQVTWGQSTTAPSNRPGSRTSEQTDAPPTWDEFFRTESSAPQVSRRSMVSGSTPTDLAPNLAATPSRSRVPQMPPESRAAHATEPYFPSQGRPYAQQYPGPYGGVPAAGPPHQQTPMPPHHAAWHGYPGPHTTQPTHAVGYPGDPQAYHGSQTMPPPMSPSYGHPHMHFNPGGAAPGYWPGGLSYPSPSGPPPASYVHTSVPPEQSTIPPVTPPRHATPGGMGYAPPSGNQMTPAPSFIGEDPSVGKSGELFGLPAGEDATVLQAMCPPGLSAEQQVRLATQTLDASALPGTHGKSTEETQMEKMLDGISILAMGKTNTLHNHLGGMSDTGWKAHNRVSLNTVKSLEELRSRSRSIQTNQDKVLAQVVTGIKSVLISANYSPVYAEQYAHQSGFLRLSSSALGAYLGLHVHLVMVASDHGYHFAETEIKHHARKLSEIRFLYITRLQVMVHTYIYLRNLQHSGWQTSSLQGERIRMLHATSPTSTEEAGGDGGVANPSTSNSRYCNHCRTALHAGHKSQCPFRQLSKTEAQEKGRELLRSIAERE